MAAGVPVAPVRPCPRRGWRAGRGRWCRWPTRCPTTGSMSIPPDAIVAVGVAGHAPSPRASCRRRADRRRPSRAILRRADLVGVSHLDVSRDTSARRPVRVPAPGRTTARDPGRPGRPARHRPATTGRPRSFGTADPDGPRGRPDRCRGHVPRRAPVGPRPSERGRVPWRVRSPAPSASRRPRARWRSRTSVWRACRIARPCSSDEHANGSGARSSRA